MWYPGIDGLVFGCLRSSADQKLYLPKDIFTFNQVLNPFDCCVIIFRIWPGYRLINYTGMVSTLIWIRIGACYSKFKMDHRTRAEKYTDLS
jgi:hypothetical protein